jgi:hypothetical protein
MKPGTQSIVTSGTIFRVVLSLVAASVMAFPLVAADRHVVRGADELFWVPTLEQGLAMAEATGRPLFLMGYSLVPDGSTYTKLGADYCSGVF